MFEDNPEEYIRRDIEGSGRLIFFSLFLYMLNPFVSNFCPFESISLTAYKFGKTENKSQIKYVKCVKERYLYLMHYKNLLVLELS